MGGDGLALFIRYVFQALLGTFKFFWRFFWGWVVGPIVRIFWRRVVMPLARSGYSRLQAKPEATHSSPVGVGAHLEQDP